MRFQNVIGLDNIHCFLTMCHVECVAISMMISGAKDTNQPPHCLAKIPAGFLLASHCHHCVQHIQHKVSIDVYTDCNIFGANALQSFNPSQKKENF